MMDRLEKIVSITTNGGRLGFFRKLAISSLLYVSTGCAGIPVPSEFHERTTTSFPSHPVIMALDAGEIKCERMYNEMGRENGYVVSKHHWLAGKQGEQQITYPSGSSNFGSNVWGCILFSYTNQTFDKDGKRFMKTYNMDSSCRKIKKIEKFLIEKYSDGWRKVKQLE